MPPESRQDPVVILLADDDAEDRMLTQRALAKSRLANEIHCVEDGEQLLDYLRRTGDYTDPETSPRPHVILLDLNMPRLSGREALEQLKSEVDLRHIPVVILTTSQEEEDVFRSYDLGANSFITKPISFEGLVAAMRGLGDYWFQIVRLPQRP